jgi:Glycosyltransferase family 87
LSDNGNQISLKRNSPHRRITTPLAFLLAVLFAGTVWFYFDHVLIPYQKADAAMHVRPRGNLSDLYPRWLGTRELLLHGRDPYSAEITREIQLGYYGRELDRSRRNDPQDQQAFAYPVYVVFLLAPFIHFSFITVQKVFSVVLWVSTALSVLLWLRALHWKASKPAILLILILTLGSVPLVQALKLQQLSLIVALLLSAAIAAVAARRFAIAGVLLAIATIKPQLALLPALWLMAWALTDWKSRKRLAIAFSASMLLLLAGAEFILPGWLGQFLVAVRNYHQYTHNTSIFGWLFTPVMGNAISILLLLITAVWCWPLLMSDSDSDNFAVALSLVMALTVVTLPMLAPYNDVLLLPAILLLLRQFGEFWRSSRPVSLTTTVMVAWPWLAALGLTIASPFLSAQKLQQGWKLPLYTMSLMPVVVFAAVAYRTAHDRRRTAKTVSP